MVFFRLTSYAMGKLQYSAGRVGEGIDDIASMNFNGPL